MRRFRFEIPVLAIAIVLLSIAFIHSASWDPRTGVTAPHASAQAKWLALSLVAFAAALAVPVQRIERAVWIFYGAALLLLVGVHFFGGGDTNGAHSWYKVRETKFQPSEIAKLAIVCAVAKALMFRKDMGTWRAWAAVAVTAGPPILSILREPDLGTVLVFSPTILVMLFVAGARIAHLALILPASLLAFGTAFAYRFSDYQKNRILVFLPESLVRLLPERLVPRQLAAHLLTHAGKALKLNEGLQTEQAHLAIGAGGLFGSGIGHGVQYHQLPERHTDFIFSVVGEEGGFLIATLLLLLLLALILVCLDVALRTREPFGRLVATGVACLLAGQIIVNCGMNIGLMPVTGVTLPLVSYGGSSLASTFVALGLVANIAQNARPVVAEDFHRSPATRSRLCAAWDRSINRSIGAA